MGKMYVKVDSHYKTLPNGKRIRVRPHIRRAPTFFSSTVIPPDDDNKDK